MQIAPYCLSRTPFLVCLDLGGCDPTPHRIWYLETSSVDNLLASYGESHWLETEQGWSMLLYHRCYSQSTSMSLDVLLGCRICVGCETKLTKHTTTPKTRQPLLCCVGCCNGQLLWDEVEQKSDICTIVGDRYNFFFQIAGIFLS